MKKLSYTSLMNLKPTFYSSIINQLGQKVDFYEHPTQGDESEIIGVIEKYKEAFQTGFFDTEEFYKDSDYNPVYMHGSVSPAWEFDL